MRNFHCDHCQNLVFFENSVCLSCGHKLGYLPDLGFLASLEPAGVDLWCTPATEAGGRTYRLCKNYKEHDICNWTVSSAETGDLCWSCRLTRTIPDLHDADNKRRWHRLEIAKRRLLYALQNLGLPLVRKATDHPAGLAFDFLADGGPEAAPVLTGHHGGIITINVAEADDVERERRRTLMHEGYRTLLAHFRHEIGHYYWDLLIRDGGLLEPYRQLFGDEREDYQQALKRHYDSGPPGQWQERFVSAYASVHSWEDWAETWAHYLHMVDTLETATACGLALQPRESGDPEMQPDQGTIQGEPNLFADMISRWFPVTFLLNNLNRGLGMPDAYPFVLCGAVIEKLQFVHNVISNASHAPG